MAAGTDSGALAASANLAPSSAKAGGDRDGAAGDAAGFEGTIDAFVTAVKEGERQEESFHFICRGDKVRWAVTGSKTWRLYDRAAKRFYSVYPTESLIVSTPSVAPVGEADASRSASRNDADGGAWKVETFDPNGRMADQACERVHVTNATQAFDGCLARGLPEIPLSKVSSLVASGFLFEPMLEERGVFPLAIATQRRRTGGSLRDGGARLVIDGVGWTVSSVARHPVDEEELRLPPFKTVENASLQGSAQQLR